MAIAALKRDQTLAGLVQYFDVHPNQIADWKNQLQERAARVLGEQNGAAAPEPDVKTRHAKIGELTFATVMKVIKALGIKLHVEAVIDIPAARKTRRRKAA